MCQRAWFLTSRGSFKILRTDKKRFEVGIPDIRNLQKNARMEIPDAFEVLDTNNALETKKPEETMPRPSQKQRLLTEWGDRDKKT